MTIFAPRNRSFSRGRNQSGKGEIIITETITDPITETDEEADGTIIDEVIGVTITRLTIDKVILDQITDKTPNRHL